MKLCTFSLMTSMQKRLQQPHEHVNTRGLQTCKSSFSQNFGESFQNPAPQLSLFKDARSFSCTADTACLPILWGT